LYGCLTESGQKRKGLGVTTVPIEVSRDHDRIRVVQAQFGFDQATTVLTSLDEVAIAMMSELPAEGLTGEFAGQLIPIVFGPGTEAVIEAEVGTRTGEHFHDSFGFITILTGTWAVRARGRDQVELKGGDWVHIPAGVLYEIEILENPAKARYRHH
jgi:quercetin dioxygenase-like cupin family protein